MAKAPVPGLAKTRLAPALGAVGAAALAERLLNLAVAEAVAAGLSAGLGAVQLWAAPDASHPAFQRLQQQHGITLATQASGDLGARMAQVFGSAWAQAPGPVLLMGTDAPALNAAVLRQAAAALQHSPAVFVPALDGGYALVGLHQPRPGLLAALFDHMLWSTAQVMADTRARLATLAVAHTELPAVADIDEAADLRHLPAHWLPAPP